MPFRSDRQVAFRSHAKFTFAQLSQISNEAPVAAAGRSCRQERVTSSILRPSIGDADTRSRLGVFPALPPDGKYELVLDRAEHSAFTDRPLPGDVEKRNPNHHLAILALCTAFWDAWLRDDSATRVWLDGEGPRSILEKDDGPVSVKQSDSHECVALRFAGRGAIMRSSFRGASP